MMWFALIAALLGMSALTIIQTPREWLKRPLPLALLILFHAAGIASILLILFAVYRMQDAKLRLTTPARPPCRKVLLSPPLPPVLPARPALPPRPRPATPRAAAMLRAASIASASIEPPVWPTLMPRPCMKLSIDCEIFRKATAHRNQTNRFPATPSFPEAET